MTRGCSDTPSSATRTVRAVTSPLDKIVALIEERTGPGG
jgi:hypothetical protein